MAVNITKSSFTAPGRTRYSKEATGQSPAGAPPNHGRGIIGRQPGGMMLASLVPPCRRAFRLSIAVSIQPLQLQPAAPHRKTGRSNRPMAALPAAAEAQTVRRGSSKGPDESSRALPPVPPPAAPPPPSRRSPTTAAHLPPARRS